MVEIIKGTVIKWLSLGRKLWFPTANIELLDSHVEEWTYKVNVIIYKSGDSWEYNTYLWVWAYLKAKWTFESYIIDFNKDIYGKEVDIVLLKKLRENKKFNSTDELRAQIQKDVELVKRHKDYVLTFGTYDLVHPWHRYFLEESKKYWNVLITIVATDANVIKFKGKTPIRSEKERVKDIHDLWISDCVYLWQWGHPMLWLKLYNPKVVCLWYDQVWFSSELTEYIKEKKLKTEIIRIQPYKEDQYKSSIIKKTLK